MKRSATIAAALAAAGMLAAHLPAAAEPAAAKSAAKPVAKKSKAAAQPAAAKPAAATAKPGAPETSALPAAKEPVAAIPASAAETAHVARYDAAIATVRDLSLSADEAARLKEAVAAAAAGRTPQSKGSDPAGRKLVDWVYYRSGYGSAGEIRAFLDANPSWPDRTLLAQRAEEALFNANASAREVKAFFATAQPKTGLGMAALAAALVADKDEAKAKTLAAQAWLEFDLPAASEAAFLKRVGSLLTEADHKRRLDRLLLNDSRWAGERNERAAVIKRVLPLISEPERKKIEARLAIFLRASNSNQLLSKLPEQAHTDWGLAVQRAQSLRRQNKDEEAWKILLAEPQATMLVKPDGWWEERRAQAYGALKAGKAKLAYDLVRDPGALSVNAAKDAAFLAGWLALRHLRDTKLALTHFQALEQAADGPLSKARAYYWLGRTYEALSDEANAQKNYQAGSGYFDTFHGQLARLKLDPKANTLKVRPPAAPTADDIARFNGLDVVRAAVLARKAGLDSSLVRAFFVHLRSHLRSEAEVAMLAHLAVALGDMQTSVRIGKTGVGRGLNLVYYAYPISSMPKYTPLRPPPETAFLLGIARQESEFNTLTLSGAGARGILQVMPITARHVCRDYKLKCEIERLMKDPSYNTMLGSAYISDRMDEFAGSYVLTLAGYNAGPGRARQWIKEFGDPRDGKIDPIDWIHRIPFEETREYVQKVLSNIQVYRARLGEEATAVRLNADLKRMSAARREAAAATAEAQ